MHQKKIPMRKCTGCAEMKEKRELVRIVKAPEAAGNSGTETSDISGTKPAVPDSKGSLTFSERIDILAQICDGLQFLHSADPPIIHRDIKASNIMVTDDRIVKDFAAGLKGMGIGVTIRKSMGNDILAACGQLAAQKR